MAYGNLNTRLRMAEHSLVYVALRAAEASEQLAEVGADIEQTYEIKAADRQQIRAEFERDSGSSCGDIERFEDSLDVTLTGWGDWFTSA